MPTPSTADAGSLVVQQSQAVAGRGGASALLRWTAGSPLVGEVRLELPHGWSPPATRGGPGEVLVAGGTCTVTGPLAAEAQTLTAPVSCPTAGTLLLRYVGATAPTAAGARPLALRTRAEGSASWTELAAPPVLRVVPAGLATLAFVAQPRSGHAGDPLAQAPVLVGVDDFGNPTHGTVRLGLRGDDDGLEGELVRPLVDGQVAFPGLRMRSAGHEQRLVAVAGPVLQVSEPFLVTGGRPAALSFRSSAASAPSGTPVRPAPVVQVRDAQGHGVPAQVEVTVRLVDAPPGTVLSGTTAVVTDGGRAPLHDLVVHGPAGRARLVAEAPGLAPADPLLVEVRDGATAGTPGAQLAALSALDGTGLLGPGGAHAQAVPPPLVAPFVPPAEAPAVAPAGAALPQVAPQAAQARAQDEVQPVARAAHRQPSRTAPTVGLEPLWVALVGAGAALLVRARRVARPRR